MTRLRPDTSNSPLSVPVQLANSTKKNVDKPPQQEYKGIISRYTVLPLRYYQPDLIYRYFTTLLHKRLLRYRFCEVDSPDWGHVHDTITRLNQGMFMVYDHKEDQLVGELTLENFHGLSACAHFSSHPDIWGINVDPARQAVDYVFTLERRDGYPWVQTMIGVLPESNRLANRFVLRLGFQYLATVPYGIRVEHKRLYDHAVVYHIQNPNEVKT